MLNAHTHLNGRQRYNIEPMVSNSSVHWALLHRFARDPEYVKAVIRSYIEVKKARGRLTNDISTKLNYLEQELPQFADSFHSVRAEYRLPPSRVLPASNALSAITSRQSLGPSISRVSSSMTPPRVARRATETRPATVRPPTTHHAPQPLPAEFRVRPDAANEDELPPPPYTRQDPEPDSTRMLQERLAAEAEATLPPDSAPATADRPGAVLVWPDTSSSRRPSSSRPTPPRPVSPPHPPEDDEIARAYEENQLEEAKRASIIAERERQEVEEAMRLSLADAPQAGPSRLAPIVEPEDGLQRRVSSYSPATLANPQFPTTHRRVVSAYSAGAEGMGQISVPGGPSLLDWDDGEGAGQAPMVPQKTGAVIQSRNPFISPNETPVSPGYTDAQLDTSAAPHEQAGSSRTLISRALPVPPRQATELPTSQESVAGADPSDPLHTLTYYQTVFLIDDAPSIAGEGWDRAQKAFTQVAKTAIRHSEEGVDVYFTNSKRVGRELRTADDIEELLAGLQARGSASVGTRLRAILREYLGRLSGPDLTSPGKERREVKPLNLVIVTDGVSAAQVIQRKRHAEEQTIPRADLITRISQDDLESVIISCAKELDQAQHPASQIGIQFLQIGSNPEARESLQELDNGLAQVYGIRDMVDLVVHDEAELSEDRINKTLFGGIDRNWDDYDA